MKKFQIGFLGVGYTKQFIVKVKDLNCALIIAANKHIQLSKKQKITTVLVEELK